MSLKEVEISSLNLIADRSKIVRYGPELWGRADFKELLEANPYYISCCIHRSRSNTAFYFGDVPNHVAWMMLLKREVGADLSDEFIKGQLWVEKDTNLIHWVWLDNIKTCEKESEKRAIIRRLLGKINPEFMTRPYVSITDDMTNFAEPYRYNPTLKRLTKPKGLI